MNHASITWKTFQAKIRPVRQEFNALLLRGVYSGNARLQGMCDELYVAKLSVPEVLNRKVN